MSTSLSGATSSDIPADGIQVSPSPSAVHEPCQSYSILFALGDGVSTGKLRSMFGEPIFEYTCKSGLPGVYHAERGSGLNG